MTETKLGDGGEEPARRGQGRSPEAGAWGGEHEWGGSQGPWPGLGVSWASDGETVAAESGRGQCGDLRFRTVPLADGRWQERTRGTAHTAGILTGEPARSPHRVLGRGPFPGGPRCPRLGDTARCREGDGPAPGSSGCKVTAVCASAVMECPRAQPLSHTQHRSPAVPAAGMGTCWEQGTGLWLSSGHSGTVRRAHCLEGRARACSLRTLGQGPGYEVWQGAPCPQPDLAPEGPATSASPRPGCGSVGANGNPRFQGPRDPWPPGHRGTGCGVSETSGS